MTIAVKEFCIPVMLGSSNVPLTLNLPRELVEDNLVTINIPGGN